ncbi:hypothetical protein AVEN_208769-1, partial [Araneus ventricosus]
MAPPIRGTTGHRSLVQKPQYYEKHEERRYVEAARRGVGHSAKKMVMPGTMDGEGHA